MLEGEMWSEAEDFHFCMMKGARRNSREGCCGEE